MEFRTDLLREVRAAGVTVDAFGTLYGVRRGKTVRAVSTRGQAGLSAIGVFASRVRGEVFLTEDDLERFETAGASAALVIAGERCGFFVRDSGGALETVRSYEEFFIQPPASPAVKQGRWTWAYVFALLPLLAFAIPARPAPPLELRLQESAGQLRISWNRQSRDPLTILDGGSLIAVNVKPDQFGITYVRRSGDVLVKLGAAQARFVGPPVVSTGVEEAQAGIREMRARLAKLRRAKAAGKARIAALQRRLQ